MSFLSRISLANKSIVALVTIAILIFGAITIPTLKKELFPSISLPAVSVVSVYQGASPSIVESSVTDPLEQNFQGIDGVQTITSYSNESTSIIEVEFNYNSDLDKAQQTLTQRIAQVQSSLPTGVTPTVKSFSISDLPVIQLAVTSDTDAATLATQLQQTVQPSLERIDGVGSVNVTGVRNQIVSITLDPAKVKAKGLSIPTIEAALQANNLTLPAGDVTSDGQTVPIKVGNTLNSLDELKNLIVGTSITGSAGAGGTTAGAGGTAGGAGTTAGAGGSGTPGGFTGAGSGASSASAGGAGATAGATPIQTTVVKLSDVATVEEVLEPSASLTRTNGKPSLGLSIIKTSDGNTVSISNAVHDQIKSLEAQLGNHTSISVISDQAPTITSSISDLVREGIIGAIFAIIVILFFLFSIRSTLVTAISIPLSIVIALIGIYVGNYTLNILTLGGLTIAVGRVVDDSIVVLENIYRHLQQGEPKEKAIPEAVREVAGAVTASTLTTVAVFLPIAFINGIVGELFNSFAVAITIALLASLFVALTIIPVLASWFLKSPAPGKEVKVEKETFLERGYTVIVRWVTGRGWHRALTLVIALFILIITFGLTTRLQTNLFGASGSNTYSISITLPATTSLDKTNAAAQKVEQALNGVSGIKISQTIVGSGGNSFASASGSSGTNTATIALTTNDGVDQTAFQKTVNDRLSAVTDAGTIKLSSGQSSGLGNSNLEVDVKASNETTLSSAAQQVQNEVAKLPGLKDVSSNLTAATPQIEVQVDPSKALKYGMTAAQVAQNMRIIYSGVPAVTSITINNVKLNVNLYYGAPATTIAQIRNLTIPTTIGAATVGDLATVSDVPGPTQVTHINGDRTASITAAITDTNVGAVSARVQNDLSKLHLPTGASYSLGGVTSQQSDTFSSLEEALVIAIALVYCIMVATFRSLLQPIILLISIPFAATGSFVLLLITKTPLGAASLIGLLMLVGIVVTNAIVLLDLVRQYRKKGLTAQQAIIEGGRHRLRPILMTAIATILALSPMALGFGGSSNSGGSFISGPLAIVVIGGLISSTILTLILVPTLYVIVESIRGRSGSAPVEAVAEVQPVAEPAPAI
jgi:hydrophobic/amphiphilic exporter-1 (mainly G- bacteria), HAE1 family